MLHVNTGFITMSHDNICNLRLFYLLLALATGLMPQQGWAQALADSVYRQEMDFGQYLLNNQLFTDAQQVFAQLDTATMGKLTPPQADSLHFYHAWACYN